jgi:Holliday junction DNA helicase RuvA
VIGSLRGTLSDWWRRAGGLVEVLVDVGGVGYRVTMAEQAAASLGPVGSEVSLHVHTHVREDALILYGFVTNEQRACFEALISVRTVGPGVALSMLAVHTPGALRRAVAARDVDALRLVPGIGAKTAARLVVELDAKLDDFDDTSAGGSRQGAPERGGLGVPGMPGAPASVREDLRGALAALGYGADEIRYAESVVSVEGPVQEVLKMALRELGARR